jgi:DNA-binding transcriptional regulator YiaG
MKIAEQLQQWRGVTGKGNGKRGKISRPEAAKILGISWRTLETWEQGLREPRGLSRSLLLSLLSKRTRR